MSLADDRDRLLEKFTVMQADLGGAFYEMAIRDHVRLDVLTRKAAELQRVDAELLAVERLLELERSDAAGTCPSCGAPYGPAIRFCGQCGQTLTAAEAEAGTGVKA
jgi:NADH pyrophosphatase NudC (nudix superfamily)